MNYKKFGCLIKERRLEKNLTQKDLADLLYITDRAVSKWERGVSLPDISMLKQISEILDIDLNELLEVKRNSVVKNNDGIKYLIVVLFIIVISCIIFVFIHSKFNNKVTASNNCDKELVKIYSKDNISIYTNCVYNVYVDKIPLKDYVNKSDFDIDKWLSSFDYVDSFYDGGSIMYENSQYRVLKCNTLDGNKDIIIGSLDMEYEDNFCKNEVEIYQKCYYTDIFRVIDILDNYPVEDNSYVFITLDQFQDHNPVNVKIDKNFVNNLEIGNYYEFKFLYYLPNVYNMNDTYDAFYNYELVSVLNTEKEGLQQVSTNKCEKLVK